MKLIMQLPKTDYQTNPQQDSEANCDLQKKMKISIMYLIYSCVYHFFISIINSIRSLGLKTKWMIFTFVFILSLSFILVSFFVRTGKNDIEKELKRWGISLADNLAYSSQQPVYEKDYITLTNYLYGIMNHTDILYSVILDNKGSILTIYDRESLLSTEILNGSLSNESISIIPSQTRNGINTYNFVAPIPVKINKEDTTSDNSGHFDPLERAISASEHQQSDSRVDRLGTIILGISTENMNKKLTKMRNKAIGVASMVALIFIVFVFWSVDRITAPIKNLCKATQKIAQGDLSHVVKKDRLDELGRLADSFNEMIFKLKESQEKVTEYTQTLKKKIDERTHELKVSEQKYRTLFEHAGTAVALIDKNGKLLMFNKRFEDLSSYSKGELEGKITLSDFLSWEDCNKIQGLCNDNGKDAETGFPLNHECTFIDRLNNRKNVNLTISFIPSTLKLLISIVDVTELRVLQKRLARSEHLAVLGELSAAIAHEIRNPLVAINTSVGILKNALNLNSEDDELMKIISEESMRLNKIVDDFLKFARPNEPQFTYTNINSLIEETLVVLRSRFNEKIQKDINLSDDLPEFSADPNQLKQVFMNIFINAIEAMPDGGLLTVSSRYVKNANRNSQPFLEVAIKDTGNGIEQQDFKKIFQPFYSNKAQGVGMGLAICERIIHNHGGQIRVESKTGKGSQFTLVLPV